MGHKVFWFTGLSGSGKSTIAKEVHKILGRVVILDGDIFRKGLSKDLGFSREDRNENLRRAAEVAKIINDIGYNVIVAFISPYKANRDTAREILGDKYVEIYIKTPLDVCVERDPKGLYKKVKNGEIKNFTGIDDPYDVPENPDIVLDTTELSVFDCAKKIIYYEKT
jgi:adenylyl-sulfate kinase